MKRVYSAVLFIIFSLSTLSSHAFSWADAQTMAGKGLGWVESSIESGIKKGAKGFFPALWNGTCASYDFAKNYPVVSTLLAASTVTYLNHWYQIDSLWNKYDEYEKYGAGKGPADTQKFRFACWQLNTWATGKNLLDAQGAVWQRLKNDLKSDVRTSVNLPQINRNDIEGHHILTAIQAEVLRYEKDLEYLETFTSVPYVIVNDCDRNKAEAYSHISRCISDINGYDKTRLDALESKVLKIKGSSFNKFFYQSDWTRPWKFRLFTRITSAGQTYWKVFKQYVRLQALAQIVKFEVSKTAPRTAAEILKVTLLGLKSNVEQYQRSQYWLVARSPDKVLLLTQMITTINLLLEDYTQPQSTVTTLRDIRDNLVLLQRVIDPNWVPVQVQLHQDEQLGIIGELLATLDALYRRV